MRCAAPSRRRVRPRGRRGVAVVEFACVCPLLLILMLGIIEAGRLFHTETAGKDPEDMQRLVRRGVKELELPSMVITLGEKGCVFCDARKGAPEDGWEPAIATDVIDPSGAGDAFFSGTMLALTRGLPMRKAVKAGTQAAHRVLRSTESTVPAAKAVE